MRRRETRNASGFFFRMAVLVSVLLSGTGSVALGQESGLAFLTIGTDAAAASRADASTASVRGAYATFWNPAALAIAGDNEVALSHHRWIDGIRTYSIAGRFSIGKKSGLGLFITGTDSGTLEARDKPGPPTGTFEAQFLTIGGSYALTLGPLRAGMTFKYISERIFNDSARGYAFDAGLHASFFNNGMHLGAVIQNIGEMSELRTQATDLPRTFRLGSQFFPFRMVNGDDGSSLVDISISADVSHNIVDENTRLHFGGDGKLLDVLFIRVGYMTNDALRGFSTGLGLEFSNIQFDYAMVPFKEGFDGPAHVISLRYGY